MQPVRLNRAEALVVVVDVQTKLTPHIAAAQSVITSCRMMLQGAKLLSIPTLVSEQNRAGLGPTIAELSELTVGDPCVEKMSFSVCRDPEAMRAIESRQRRQILLIGIETHVCVMQTALDLCAAGLTAVVIADATGSRKASDRDFALDRMRHAGVVVTTVEAALFELAERAGSDEFRALLRIVK